MTFFNSTLIIQTLVLLSNNKTEKTELQTKIPQNFYKINNISDSSKLCYNILGCFSIEYPWYDTYRKVDLFPEDPQIINPEYCLYTPNETNTCHVIVWDNPNTFDQLNPENDVVLISHGFLEIGTKPWIKMMVKKLMTVKDFNIITISWPRGAYPPYVQAVSNIRLIGTLTGLLINNLYRYANIHPERCHFIGHSLGAHLGGYAGNTLHTRYGLRLGRITGLDPAEPHFSKTDPIVRLDSTDAIFVDVIHTDTTPFMLGGLGMDEPIGHLDFYPNGGEDQPGCYRSITETRKEDNVTFFEALHKVVGCDHRRSYNLFLESITTRCEFLSIECDSWKNFKLGKCWGCKSNWNPDGFQCSRMGYWSMDALQEIGGPPGKISSEFNRTEVSLFTITNPGNPFCRNLYRITIHISTIPESIQQDGEIGSFSVRILGVKGFTKKLPLSFEGHYSPGVNYTEVLDARYVGRVKGAVVTFQHDYTLNIFSWRLRIPYIYLDYIVIDSLYDDSSLTLCPPDGPKLKNNHEYKLKPCGQSMYGDTY